MYPLLQLATLCHATFTSPHEGHSSVDETEPDHGSAEYGMVALQPIRSPGSTVTSPTYMHIDTASDRSTPHPAKSDTGFSGNNVASSGPPLNVSSDSQKLNQENGGITKVEFVQDKLVDPGPFKLRPFELASLLDSKCLEALSALGGVDAILEGLGTRRTRGLTIVSRGSSDSRPGASQRHDRMDEHPLSTIAVTAPHDISQDEENSGPHLASLSERRRVFGENVLPQLATKSLLALMWLALKDKVLVRIILHRFSIIFIFFISRSCCLSQRFALWRSDSFEIPNASPC